MREVGVENGPTTNLGRFAFTATDDGLGPGLRYTRSERITLPTSLEGVYEVHVRTNSNLGLFELGAGRENNLSMSADPLQVAQPARPDLQVESIEVPDTTVFAGGTIDVSFTIINQGTVGTTTPMWTDAVFLSLDNKITPDDIQIGSFKNQSALPAGEHYETPSKPLVVPKRYGGEVFVIVQTDSGGRVNEQPNEGNNTSAVSVFVQPLPPSDLVVSDVVSPDEVFDGSTIEVRYTVTNLGVGPTDRDGWTDTIWLARDRTRPSPKVGELGKGDIKLRTLFHTGGLDAAENPADECDEIVGHCYLVVTTLKLPSNLEGQFFITPWSDALNVVTETTLAGNINPDDPNQLDNNNYKARPITIRLTPPPDLEVTDVTPDVSGLGGQPFTVRWTVTNNGSARTQTGVWADTIYLADAANLQEATQLFLLDSVVHSTGLEPAGFYTKSHTVELTPAAEGMFVIVETNSGGHAGKTAPVAWEGSLTNNNTLAAATNVTNQRADLQVIEVITDDDARSGEEVTIEWTVKNVGPTVWPGTEFWTDRVYLSPDPQFIAGRETQLGDVPFGPESPLATGQTYTQSATFTLPRGIDGQYFIYVQTNLDGRSSRKFSINQSDRGFFRSHVLEDPSNNILGAPMPVLYYEPDLQVTDLQVTGLSVPEVPPRSGEMITVQWTTTNLGVRDTREKEWFDRVYLSTDESLDDSDQHLGSFRREQFLATDDHYQASLDVTLPNDAEGDYFVLVMTDSNVTGSLPPDGPGTSLESPFYVNPIMARVFEFQDEGNNITAEPMSIELAPPPDLRVTALSVPDETITGQEFEITYTVTNTGTGPTSALTPAWDDLIYLSSDQFLDLKADRYLGFVRHTGELGPFGSPSDSYTVGNLRLRAPRSLVGLFYVFVVTDPASAREPIGEVFEGRNENNNQRASSPQMEIMLPPPSDLQADPAELNFPSPAQSGEPITITWTGRNLDENPATGPWSDAVYLSNDARWDVTDPLLGRVRYQGAPLAQNDPYTLSLENVVLPPATPGSYRLIVRLDIFNEVHEAENEANNRVVSQDTLSITVDSLRLNEPLDVTLGSGQQRLFQINAVGLNETLRVHLDSGDRSAANELFIRHDALPTAFAFDARDQGPLEPDQIVTIAGTQAGTYFLLARNLSAAAADVPITLLAETVPFSIDDVQVDHGGDTRYVTATITGAQFHEDAIVKLVRPGIAEYEPESWAVVDSTKIVAVFDFTDAPRGLYDVKVINPGGAEAVVPYRYLVERAIEPVIDVGLGGERVLWPGDTGRYGFTLVNRSNVDLPYVNFTFGVPELGENPAVFNLPRVAFSSNLRGAPDVPSDDVPWASLDSAVNTDGEILAPGYALDLVNGGFAQLAFTAQTYPGLAAILARDFERLLDIVERAYPEYADLLREKGPDGLADIEPGGETLLSIWNNHRLKPLDDVLPEQVGFTFHILASATPLTPDEFVAQQRAAADRLRAAILADPDAPQALTVLAADSDEWGDLFIQALTDAGVLRPVDVPPVPSDRQETLSLMSILTAGLLAGPAGSEIIDDAAGQGESGLVDFFETVRRWYGHDVSLLGQQAPLPVEGFDLGLTAATLFEAFNIYVPFENRLGKFRPDIPGFVDVAPPEFDRFFEARAVEGVATITGPVGFGVEQFVPLGHPLPYTVRFENPEAATDHVAEVEVGIQLDDDLDPRTFRLGDIRLGDITVNIPSDLGSFTGDFDFTDELGLVLRVTGGVDVQSSTARWLFQAIDPDTGEILQNATRGLLPPDDGSGRGEGFVTYSIQPRGDRPTGTELTTQARVIFNTAPPEDTSELLHTLDAVAPTTTLTVAPLSAAGDDVLLNWQTVDDDGGAGVRHVTIYVAENGGMFRIWQGQLGPDQSSAVFEGEPGRSYEFIALATDLAGNREAPPLGVFAPDDGTTVNLGSLPMVDRTGAPDLGDPPSPTPDPSTNPLFAEAEQQIPNVISTSRSPEFDTVISPFTAQAFATGFDPSHAEIGPMAILPLEDGSVLASGGENRGSLFRFGFEGGDISPGSDSAGDSSSLIATLPHPIFDLAMDHDGRLWAATGGGPLLELDPQTGVILAEHGASITQAVEVDPATGAIYISTSRGVETFDPASGVFTLFSELRVGSLAFGPQAVLWAATWPERGGIVRFGGDRRAELVFRFETAVDSIAFGRAGTSLENLLFVTHNNAPRDAMGSELTMVDVATLRHIPIARGGTRGDMVATTADGRVLISQSNQIDVLNAAIAPRIVATNPPPNALVALPRGEITITFDTDMLVVAPVGGATAAHSVTNPANYQLIANQAGEIGIRSIRYDASLRTVTLQFDSLAADAYDLVIRSSIASVQGPQLASSVAVSFTTLLDFTPLIDLQLETARSSRGQGTISYDVTVTNIGNSDLILPLTLLFNPAEFFKGSPAGGHLQPDTGFHLIPLENEQLALGGRLRTGESITGQTITINNPLAQRIDAKHGVYALPQFNVRPEVFGDPVRVAAVDTLYSHQISARDFDDEQLFYVLFEGPLGMTVDAQGIVSWVPTNDDPAVSGVTVFVFDGRGAFDKLEYTIDLEGGNHAPAIGGVRREIAGREGERLRLFVGGSDDDGDALTYHVNNLPPGAVFDPRTLTFQWTPDFDQAGVYPDVEFVVSDGRLQARTTTTIRIAPNSQPPSFIPHPDVSLLEGEPIEIQLLATDPDGDALLLNSGKLPPGARLNRQTGVFTWTPAFHQHGVFEVPFTVSDGEWVASQTVSITVVNVNAPPRFGGLDGFVAQENQLVRFRATAFDPDNPSYEPPDRDSNGTLLPHETTDPTVSYSANGLPAGAAFDVQTALFDWTPGFTDAGEYEVTITATDTGDGTGIAQVSRVVVPITVLNTNRPPVITDIENVTLGRADTLDLSVQATDSDGDPVVLAAISALAGFDLPSFITFMDNGDGTGLFHIAPQVGDRGDYPVTLIATDDGGAGSGQGSPEQVGSDELTFIVTVESPNEPPILPFIGDKVAVVDKLFSLGLFVSDLDQDALTFEVVGLPAGALLTEGIVYGTAAVEWTPTLANVGTHTVTFRVTDSGNGDPGEVMADEETIDIVVRQSNAAPILAPVGDRSVDEGQTLQFTLAVTDADGDPLTFSATNLPPGAIFDRATGTFEWTPHLFQAGLYENVDFSASDGNGSSSESIRIVVGNVNQPPILVPTAVQAGREGAPLSFRIVAGDPDGDPLVLTALTPLPTGAVFNGSNGQFNWTPNFDQAAEYVLRFAVQDVQGGRDELDVTLAIENVNRAPTLSVDSHAAVVGQSLTFIVDAFDPDDGETLTFTVDGLPQGAVIEQSTGQVSWTPTPGQTGDFVVHYSVSDGEAVATRSAVLRSLLTRPEPTATLVLTPSFPVTPGQPVLVHVLGSSLAEIAEIQVMVDGAPLELDESGRGQFNPLTPGRFRVEAKVTDADGFMGTATGDIKVRHPLDEAAPVVVLDPSLSGAMLDSAQDIVATVADLNLDVWSLEIKPLGYGDWRTIASSHTPFTNEAIATLDADAIANGFYQLRLTATDISGRTSSDRAAIEVHTQAKPTRLYEAVDDLSFEVGNQTFEIVRAYDSLSVDVPGTFGFGWRAAGRDLDIQSDVGLQGGPVGGAFQPGTRVMLTLPDGRRVAYTFEPQPHTAGALTYYTPAFVPDAGVNHALEAPRAVLQRAGDRFYDLKSGRAYNPLASDQMMTITTPDGTEYGLRASRGVERITYVDNTAVMWNESGVTTSSGQHVQFIYNARGRIGQIIGPTGESVNYEYDTAGNLISARQTSSGEATRYGYDGPSGHRLMLHVASAGGEVIDYTPAPVAAPITADLGASAQFLTAVTAGSLAAGQLDRYTLTMRPSELRSTASGFVYLIAEVTGHTGLAPGPPVIRGVEAIVTQQTGDASASLFALADANIKLLEISGVDGAAAGNYSLRLTIAGDVNGDRVVNSDDAQLQAIALGTIAGEPGYIGDADVNRDGVIDGTDTNLLAANLGFVFNGGPSMAVTSLLTHVDLAVPFDLSTLADDAEGDAVGFRISGADNGSAFLRPDGQTVVFTPTPGYEGPASFNVVADDGFAESPEVTVQVDVSDAPLISFDYLQRTPQVDIGGSVEMALIGDFADQSNVMLPANYVTMNTDDATVARIERGSLVGVSTGTGVLTATRGELRAVTAFVSGTPALPEHPSLIYGIDVHPGSLTLVPDGFRQLLVTIPREADVSEGDTGTLYFVDRPGVVDVDVNGLVTAQAEGEVNVIVIHDGQEAVVPVRVVTPQAGSGMVDETGGAIVASDGAVVSIGPGALLDDTDVSFTPVAELDLPMPVPSDWDYVAAYNLDLSGQVLSEPGQLRLPVPDHFQPGSGVVIFHLGELLEPDLTTRPIWFQQELGTVGDDGFAYTNSPPWPGTSPGGIYLLTTDDLLEGGLFGVRLVKGKLSISYPIGGVPVLLPGGEWASVTPFLVTTVDISELTIRTITPEFEVIDTSVPVTLSPDGTFGEFEATVDPPSGDTFEPFITGVKLVVEELQPRIELSGRNLLKHPKAGGDSQVDVFFRMNNVQTPGVIVSQSGGGDDTIQVEPPRGVAVGLADIYLVRRDPISFFSSLFGNIEPTFTSNAIQLTAEGNKVFAALRSLDQVAVMDQGDPDAAEPESTMTFDALIPVGDSPRSVATTADLTRAYVTNINDGTITVIDAMTLQAMDTVVTMVDGQPDTEIDPIKIKVPGARPFWITLDRNEHYAYVTDEVSPAVYVIGINPASADFHKYITTIKIELDGAVVPFGLRGAAVDVEGRKLYVAAPNQRLFGTPQLDRGHIIVINIDQDDRPADLEADPNPRMFWKVIGVIEADQETYAVTTATQRDKMFFTNRDSDSTGFGIISVSNDDPTSYSADVGYIGLNHGPIDDYLDINDGQGIAVTPDGEYAFVTGFNKPNDFVLSRNPFSGDLPGGSTVGIIKDPLGPEAEVIAVTRPIPVGLPDNPVLSGDGRYLWVPYRNIGGGDGVVMVYDVNAMIAEIERSKDVAIDVNGFSVLDRVAVNDLTGGEITQQAGNTMIDIRADYRINFDQSDIDAGQFVFDVPGGQENNPHAPIATGGTPQGLAAQQDWLELISPLGPDHDNLALTFEWDTGDVPVDRVKLYVSVVPRGQGLLPGDRPLDSSINSSEASGPQTFLEWITELESIDPRTLRRKLRHQPGVDFNPNRIVTEVLAGGESSYTLRNHQALTRSGTYYWAVEAFAADGRKTTKFGTFETAPLDDVSTPFSSVTLITHGWSIAYADGQPAADFRQLAQQIAQTGDGVVLQYNKEFDPTKPESKLWRPIFGGSVGEAAGKPLVLVSDWVVDSAISDSGFAEGAADALFAGLVQLDQETGGDVFTSPMHLIGFSRGTSVTSEISQRIGTYFPSVPDVHVTTLDPHDFNQPSLSIPFDQALKRIDSLVDTFQAINKVIGVAAKTVGTGSGGLLAPIAVAVEKASGVAKFIAGVAENVVDYLQEMSNNFGWERVRFDDFLDPNVYVWSHETFHDNYWQHQATTTETQNLTTAREVFSFTATPNGRPITPTDEFDIPDYSLAQTQAQIDLDLNGRAGWTDDDSPIRFAMEGLIDDVEQIAKGLATVVPDLFGAQGFVKDLIEGIRKKTRDAAKMIEIGLGAPHFRVKPWYAGTVNLSLEQFPITEGNSFIGAGQELWRTPADSIFAPYQFVVSPWYRAQEQTPSRFTPLGSTAYPNRIDAERTPVDPAGLSWEGIGNGWFYSVLGGGDALRDEHGAAADPTDLFFDNTEHRPWDAPVPSVFNGNFEASVHAFYGRYPQRINILEAALPSWLSFFVPNFERLEVGTGLQIPGWSFHGGGGGPGGDEQLQGAMLLELIEPDDLVAYGVLTQQQIDSANPTIVFDRFVELKAVMTKAVGNKAVTAAQVEGLRQATLDGNVQRVVLLDDDSSSISHNRFYLPPLSSIVQFDLAGNTGSGVTVQFTPTGGGSPVNIGEQILAEDLTSFRTFSLDLPQDILGKVGTLNFTLVGSGVFLDNVELDGLIITDSSGDDADGNVLFYEFDTAPGPSVPDVDGEDLDAPPLEGDPPDDTGPPDPPVQPFEFSFPQRVLGRDLHVLTLRNNSNIDQSVQIVVQPNDFLVYIDDFDNEVPVNELTESEFLEPILISAMSEAEVRFASRLPENYMRDLQEEELLILSAKLFVLHGDPQNPNAKASLKPINLYYVADIADDDVNDARIKMQTTLSGQTRRMNIHNPSRIQIDFSDIFEGNASDFFVAADGQGLFFKAPDVASPQISEAEIQLLDDRGRELLSNEPIHVQAIAAPRYRFAVDFGELRNLFIVITQDPTRIDSVAGMDPGELAKYDRFRSMFPDPESSSANEAIFDTRFNILRQNFMTTFRDIYFQLGGVSPEALEIVETSNPLVNDIEWLLFDFDVKRQNDSEAKTLRRRDRKAAFVKPDDLGFYFTTYNDLIRGQVPLTGTGPNTGPTGVAEQVVSPASLRYRLDSVINAEQYSRINMVIDNLVRRRVRSTDSPATLGQSWGLIAAHEFAHNIGLLDEYDKDDMVVTTENFMSKDRNRTVTTEHRMIFNLAFNDPRPGKNVPLTESVFAIRPLVVWQNMTDANDDDLRNPRGTKSLPGHLMSPIPNESSPSSFIGDSRTPIPGGAAGGAALTTVGVATPLNNGDFAIENPSDPDFGWLLSGQASVGQDTGMLAEDGSLNSGFQQTFVLQEGAKNLHFTVLSATITVSENTPADVFEVALLNAATMQPLVATPEGLSNTDAFLNIQGSGQVYFGDGVAVPGVAASGDLGSFADPVTVSVDVSHIPTGTPVTLYFDLLGFGDVDARVVIDNVRFDDGTVQPDITVTPTAGLVTSEDGDTAQFTIVLATQPTADVTVGLSSSKPEEGVPTVDQLVFTPDNWDTPQTVTVMGMDDDRVDGGQPYRIVTGAAESDDPAYDGLDPDDVLLVNLDNDGGVLPLVLQLDPEFDSGVPDDNLTRLSTVELIGTTEPLSEVLLDVDGDGFDDGSTTADENGDYRFVNVALVEGLNLLRTQIGTGDQVTEAAVQVVLDSQRPAGDLAVPESDAVVAADLGYVEIQWTDFGLAGLDPSSFDAGDLLIAGVTVDRAEDLSDGRVRYWYGEDGDRLSAGLVTVAQVAGEIADLAGNTNLADTDSFTVDDALPTLEVIAAKDDGDWGYRERGIWQAGPLPAGWQGDYRQRVATEEGGTASWVTRIEAGQYEFFVTWPADAGHAADVTYRILDGRTEVGRVQINQQLAPDGAQYDGDAWESLGVFDISTGVPTVELSYAGTGTVVADGVLIARPSPVGATETEPDDVASIGTAYRETRPQTAEPASVEEADGEPQVELGAAHRSLRERLDVDRDQFVSPLDALHVINYLNRYGSQDVNPTTIDFGTAIHDVDVNDDGVVSPLDVLLIVNYLNGGTRADADPSGVQATGDSTPLPPDDVSDAMAWGELSGQAGATEPSEMFLTSAFAAWSIEHAASGPAWDRRTDASDGQSVAGVTADQRVSDTPRATLREPFDSGRDWSSGPRWPRSPAVDDRSDPAAGDLESVLAEIADELSNVDERLDARVKVFGQWEYRGRFWRVGARHGDLRSAK